MFFPHYSYLYRKQITILDFILLSFRDDIFSQLQVTNSEPEKTNNDKFTYTTFHRNTAPETKYLQLSYHQIYLNRPKKQSIYLRHH